MPAERHEYSGKFVVRIPKSLHRKLAESAETEGVSLNLHVGTLLAAGQREREMTRRGEQAGSREIQRLQPAS